MTVCLYASPNNVPILISDCIALPTYERFPALRPENFHFNLPIEQSRLTHLASKTFLIDDHTIASFAGSARSVGEFMLHFPAAFQNRKSAERPMQYAGRIVDEYNRSPGVSPISMLGVQITAEGINTCSPLGQYHQVETKHFGICHLIGSGKEQLLKSLTDFENNPKIQDSSATAAFNTVEYILSIYGALTSEKLFETKYVDRSRSWGGYFELFFFDGMLGKWRKFPSWLNMQLLVPANNFEVFRIFGNAFAYTGSQRVGSESWLFGFRDRVFEREFSAWKISPLFPDKMVGPRQVCSSALKNFTPKRLTYSFYTKENNGPANLHGHRTLLKTEMKKFRWT